VGRAAFGNDRVDEPTGALFVLCGGEGKPAGRAGGIEDHRPLVIEDDLELVDGIETLEAFEQFGLHGSERISPRPPMLPERSKT